MTHDENLQRRESAEQHQRRDQAADAEKSRDLPDPPENPDDRPAKVSEIRREQEQLDPNRPR